MVSMVLEKTMVFVNFFCKEKKKKNKKQKTKQGFENGEFEKCPFGKCPFGRPLFFGLEIKEKLEKDSFS